MSPMGLRNFLAGATPYVRTAEAIRAWFEAYANEPLPPKPRPPRPRPLAAIGDDALRAALERAVATASLRSVAEQVGITHQALHLYIRGESRPREVTIHKLREWYLRQAPTLPGTDRATARAVIAVLVKGLPPDEQDRATEEISSVVRNAYARAKLEPPAWAANAA
jgi:transcriptional regulator with XRE-family HTH domain